MQIMENIFFKETMLRERKDAHFTVAFDMDNTLFNEKGTRKRHGIENALDHLKKNKIKMVVWTNSTRNRAVKIMKDGGLSPYFTALIARESYDIEEIRKHDASFYKKIEKGFPREIEFQKKFKSGKNLSLLGYDVLVDDNPGVRSEAAFWGNSYDVMVCESFASGRILNVPNQMEDFAKRIVKTAKPGFFNRLFSR